MRPPIIVRYLPMVTTLTEVLFAALGSGVGGEEVLFTVAVFVTLPREPFTRSVIVKVLVEPTAM